MKKVLITGITGQDGSYLAELLLNKGYEVHGIVRRAAIENPTHRFWRIKHILNKLIIHGATMENYASVFKIVEKVRPDECYHLAAQSFVAHSFEDIFSTLDININGTLHVLSAIKELVPDCRFYFAASSEMFGKVKETPQNEDTPFYPRSPYGISKVAGFDLTRNYRESYNIFGCSGILFNHESILKNSPIMVKKDSMIDIIPIEDIFRTDKHKYEGLLDEYVGSYVWDGGGWTKILKGTCYKDHQKKTMLVQTRRSCCETTYEHILFKTDDSQVRADDICVGDKMFNTGKPHLNDFLYTDLVLSKFIGYVVGDGYVSPRGKIRLTGTDCEELIEISELVCGQFGWKYKISNNGPGYYEGCENDIYSLDIRNDHNFGLWLRSNIYTKRSYEKRIPKFILNAGMETKKSFVEGYYMADGRNKGDEKYKYKGFTTKSATLCLGVNLLINSITDQIPKTKCDYREGRRYYYTQFRSPNSNKKGKHLKKELNEVIKIFDTKSTDGWFYDIQTESQAFSTGPNLFKIHNSPRRGLEFVTRKITNAVSKIKKGEANELRLGNLDARRDWGFAGDYVKAMWMMLQQQTPEDYVIATGETHSIKEFLEAAFSYVDLDWKNYVIVDERFFRPADVNLLVGDCSKAKNIIGWEPNVKFNELVEMMMKFDLEND